MKNIKKSSLVPVYEVGVAVYITIRHSVFYGVDSWSGVLEWSRFWSGKSRIECSCMCVCVCVCVRVCVSVCVRVLLFV